VEDDYPIACWTRPSYRGSISRPLRVGIIGDFDPNLPSHISTNEALDHAAGALSVAVDCSWLDTQLLDEASGETMLKQFDALWCSSGGPYRSMAGALRAIQFAREAGWPFIGT
jgi:CTP synthase (UTP-ammonia lyase)